MCVCGFLLLVVVVAAAAAVVVLFVHLFLFVRFFYVSC